MAYKVSNSFESMISIPTSMAAECEYPTADGKVYVLSKQQRVELERNLKSIHTERKQWLREHDVQINNFKKMHKCFLPKIDSQQELKMKSKEPSDKQRESKLSLNTINSDWKPQEQFKTVNRHIYIHRPCPGEHSKSNLSADFNFLQTQKMDGEDREDSVQIRRKSEPMALSTSPVYCGLASSRRSSVSLPPRSSIPFRNTFVKDFNSLSTGNTAMNSQVHTPAQYSEGRDKDPSSNDYTVHTENNEVISNVETEHSNFLVGITFRRNSSGEGCISDEGSSISEEVVNLQETCSSAENDCELSKTAKSREVCQSTTCLFSLDLKHIPGKNLNITESTDLLNTLATKSTQMDRAGESRIVHPKDELNEYDEGGESKSKIPLHSIQLNLIKKACDAKETSRKNNSLVEPCMQLCLDPLSATDISLEREIYYRQSTKNENIKENKKQTVKNVKKPLPSEMKDYEIKTLKTLLKFSKGTKKAELMTRLMNIYRVNDIPTLKASWRDSLLECNYLRGESENSKL